MNPPFSEGGRWKVAYTEHTASMVKPRGTIGRDPAVWCKELSLPFLALTAGGPRHSTTNSKAPASAWSSCAQMRRRWQSAVIKLGPSAYISKPISRGSNVERNAPRLPASLTRRC